VIVRVDTGASFANYVLLMTRRVAYRKAILAGALGSVLFGLTDQLLYAAGLPVFNLVRALGTLVFAHEPVQYWLSAGFALNMGVGAIWAVFYSYFFWSVFPWRPVVQGLVFAAIPLTLAGFLMVPQLDAMNSVFRWEHYQNVGIFARHLGWWGPIGLILSHACYGLVLGAVYTHPVGYAVTFRRRVAHG
jgi:hypothetical protein